VRADGCDECVELAADSGRGDVVEVVAGVDDLTVADTEHEDAGQRERLSGVGDGSLIFELGDDDFGVGVSWMVMLAGRRCRAGPASVGLKCSRSSRRAA
jgi:hypothetical protein